MNYTGLNTPNLEYLSIKLAGNEIALSSSCIASFKPPYNQIDIKLKPTNTELSYYEVRITGADESYDIGVGTRAELIQDGESVTWLANMPMNAICAYSLPINSTNFKQGDGTYRISFYAKSASDGSWDVSYLYFTLDQYFTLSDGSTFAVLTDQSAPAA